MLKRLFILVIITCNLVVNGNAQQQAFYSLFNSDWTFIKDIDTTGAVKTLSDQNNRVRWEAVQLPHTPRIEAVEKKEEQWQGTCYYRKIFTLPATAKGKHVAVQFDAAMHEADVYLNGKQVFRHVGGYLPFYIDLSDQVNYTGSNVILVKLNNQDNPVIPPGKPIKGLDFNFYGGIYRNAWLVIKDKLYISNAVQANRQAGGGVLLNYTDVSKASAMLHVKIEIKSDYTAAKNAQVKVVLTDAAGKVVLQSLSPLQSVKPGSYGTFTQKLKINSPKLWSPAHPVLYTLSIQVLSNGKVTDRQNIKTGVRTIRFAGGGFYINGEKLNLRGTNRHQEYPYAGYALSDNAQYRDAFKIKDAGFNFVRCSHYPHSTAFLAACDELGILVLDAIPGWQFFGNDKFQENSLQDIREMIHSDRNYTSVIAWEASLNESRMSNAYMDKSHAIVHQELPFEGVYTAGWTDYAYDIFIPARQHGKSPDYWKKYGTKKPLLIAEYGDWEYYASNAGFNQTAYADLQKDERNSRQLRSAGQKRLLQQALNYQESHNDNLHGPAVGDANWLIFDYKRGYADDIEASGIMDIFRLPKPAFYFYQSQAGPVMNGPAGLAKPMLFIANYWATATDKTVKIYSNCDEVELLLNGKSLGKQKPDKDQYSTNLKHPPFTFNVTYQPGTLTAVGYIAGKKAAEAVQKTPGKPAKIKLRVDYSGKTLKAGAGDMVFVYADITDDDGTVIPGAINTIEFSLNGDAVAVGPSAIAAEAGIATLLLKAATKPGAIKITARSAGLQAADLTINSK